MIKRPILIYCAAGNRQFAEIAIKYGFKYGAQLPSKVYFPIFFADQDWKNPNRSKYMQCLAKHEPVMATVLDWEREEQLTEILDWAEEASQYVQEDIIIIPKVVGCIHKLPRKVNDKRIVLGYSVPTRYGGTFVPIWEFAGWPVHLLGGSPQKQMELWMYFRNIAEVVSADGNMINYMATQRCQFWSNKKIHHARNRHWTMLKDVGLDHIKDAPYEAFRRSCENIMQAWQELCG